MFYCFNTVKKKNKHTLMLTINNNKIGDNDNDRARLISMIDIIDIFILYCFRTSNSNNNDKHNK